MNATNLYGLAQANTARALIGADVIADTRNDLYRQILVALANRTSGGGGGSGTVTSVGLSFTGGVISVAGSPITTSGTLALTVAGTSGGIPYFSSAGTWGSSAALAANALVVGGGAGAAPGTVTTGTGILSALGNNIGSAGAPVLYNGVLGTPSGGNLGNCSGYAATNLGGIVAANNGGTGVLNSGTISVGSNTTITGGGTLALGGFTLTVPATGTAALLGTANVFSANGALSAPAMSLTGTVITGGTAITNKPQFLIEPAGTTSTAWNTAGTMIGVNAPSGFTGRLASFQNNGVEKAYVRNDGALVAVGGIIGFNTIYDPNLNVVFGAQTAIGGANGFYWNALQINGPMAITNPQALSGAGAVNLSTTVTKFTSTGAAQALTLADGTDGQIKVIVHVAAGGTGILTPTTKSGFTTITFTSVGDNVTLQFATTVGWFVRAFRGITIA